jgi:hypothetical protein
MKSRNRANTVVGSCKKASSTISSASGVLAVRGTPTRPFFAALETQLFQHVRSNAEMHLTKGDSVGEIVWHTASLPHWHYYCIRRA